MIKNIFSHIPEHLPRELFETLLEDKHLKIERIISRGHASAPGFWYDAPLAEWVVLLKGSATLCLEGRPEPLELKPGDYLNIPAHARHRVEKTDPVQETVWLAIYY